MDTTATYRWYSPGRQNLAHAISDLAALTRGPIIVHKADEDAARATLAANRVQTLPHGGPQPGQIWLAVA